MQIGGHQRDDAAVAEAEPDREHGQRQEAAGAEPEQVARTERRLEQDDAGDPAESVGEAADDEAANDAADADQADQADCNGASPMPRSRAAAETCAKGMNIAGAANTLPPHLQLRQARRSSAASLLERHAVRCRAGPPPVGARRTSSVAPTPTTSTAAAIACSAWRQPSASIAAVASSGTASVPTPMPALAMPAACGLHVPSDGARRQLNGGSPV